MSETTNLKLFKHDDPANNTNLFDVTKSLNENWDKIDEYVTEQEATREENEIVRQAQEEIRQSNENVRQSQEETRQSNETIRNEKEAQREEYITELKERVENGEFKGDPNILTIGNVSSGEEASAEIVGDSPNQKLNLVLPKGDKGNVGDKGETGNGIANIEDTEVTHKSGTIDKYTINYTDGTTKEIQIYNGKDGEGSGDMQKSVYDLDNDGIVDEANHAKTTDNATNADTAINANTAKNADTVNNHTVEKDVPSNAIFTDTTNYEELSNLPTINSIELKGNKTTKDFNISYNDLNNKPQIPTVPTKLSEFTDDLFVQVASEQEAITQSKANPNKYYFTVE